jgi:hypothetical protein
MVLKVYCQSHYDEIHVSPCTYVFNASTPLRKTSSWSRRDNIVPFDETMHIVGIPLKNETMIFMKFMN